MCRRFSQLGAGVGKDGGTRRLKVAIVGGGPRGLGAGEALAALAGERAIDLTVFERHPAPGAGPNYDPRQTALDLLNVPVRAIDLPPAADGRTFADWRARHAPELGEDDYPPRALIGRYLAARFDGLVRGVPASFRIALCEREAVDCRGEDGGWIVTCADGSRHGPFDEVLLCLGHQPVADGQIDRWQAHARRCGGVLARAYPDAELLDAAEWRGRTVAIRGFGLAMIDVVRMLTEGLGGAFESAAPGGLVYRRSGREPAKLLPFSLNGMPPAPKPATGALDARYAVSEAEEALFRDAVASDIAGGDAALDATFRALSAIAGRVSDRNDGSRVLAWLRDGATADPDVPDKERPAQAMRRYLAMARGADRPSVGYAAGQVWRHLQSPLREAYNPLEKSPDVAKAFTAFDDGMKRFSYGPPAEATARQLALIDAGVLTLRQVDDPDIECVGGGWRIVEGDDADVASAMVDSVLPGPDPGKATAPLLVALRQRGLIGRLGEEGGAHVAPDGRMIASGGRPVAGLSMLGRLATGSVIATDSLHDAFGAAVRRWAAGIAAR